MSISSSDRNRQEAGKLEARQRRSQVTCNKLIEAAFALLLDRHWDAIPVAEDRRAGRLFGTVPSMPASRDKDEFQTALMQRYTEDRLKRLKKIFIDAR